MIAIVDLSQTTLHTACDRYGGGLGHVHSVGHARSDGWEVISHEPLVGVWFEYSYSKASWALGMRPKSMLKTWFTLHKR